MNYSEKTQGSNIKLFLTGKIKQYTLFVVTSYLSF